MPGLKPSHPPRQKYGAAKAFPLIVLVALLFVAWHLVSSLYRGRNGGIEASSLLSRDGGGSSDVDAGADVWHYVVNQITDSI